MKRIVWASLIAMIILFVFFFLRPVFSGKIILDPVIFQFGRLQVRWYGVLIASGILTAYFVARTRIKVENINEDQVIEGLFYGVIAGVIGARLYYVAFNWNYFSENPADIFKIWYGGLAIHGALIAAVIVAFLYTRLKKGVTFGFLQILDIALMVFPLAQSIGRWGNFFNYEAFGKPTNLPWKMYIPVQNRPPMYRNYEYFHPTFLYESIWDLIVFLLLYIYTKKYRKKFGETTALYMILYSTGRFFVEGLRLDSLYIGNLRTAQVMSAVLILLGILLFVYIRRKGSKLIPSSF
ncbi:MAG: phosphatidylglycerol---prolipoprotein diacylglyceryl transferase [Thermotogaceae bacterium]|nr:phosphatidylglycerol---prolipoprotein diacylglyceryl transferase [Thermotogaceae bacterium]